MTKEQLMHSRENTQEIKPGRCYLLFEEVPLLQGERVGLCNDGDNIDHLTETSHEFHIERPQTEEVIRRFKH